MAGETTSRTGISDVVMPKAIGPMLTGAVWTTELATSQLQLADVLNMGYLPKGVTLVGFIPFVDDLDADASPALVWKITVGSTDVKTGLTLGQAASLVTNTGGFIAVEPLTTTATTLVSVTVTTAAATAAAGTFCLVPVYIGN